MHAARLQSFALWAIPIIAVTVFLIDLFTPRGISDWVWYFIPLMLSAYTGRKTLPLLLAAVFSALSLAGYSLSPPGVDSRFVFVSHLMGICVFWLLAGLIVERLVAGEKLREQSELLELSPDAILVCDLEDRILFWNRSAERIYGWSHAEAMKQKSTQLLRKDAGGFEEVKRIILEKGGWIGELVGRTKGGKEVLIEARWTLVRNVNGTPKSILTINTDITEKKQLQAQLLRTQRMESIGTLAGGIAHDLNNILAPLLFSIGLLRQKISDAEGRVLLAAFEANVQRGANLIKQVLTFGRGVSGERGVVEPARLARELQQIIHTTFPKSVEFECHCADNLWSILGDSTQLHQVLLNLCINARDAMPLGGKLSLLMDNEVLDTVYAGMNPEARPGPHIVIQVTDTGTGIPPEVRDRIFEPFFTTKEKGRGTGLGLSTTVGIVKSHGGFIHVYSEVNQGSTFKVYLPARTQIGGAKTTAATHSSLPRGRNELILLVDDEEPIRTIVGLTLNQFGYRTLLAENGAVAVSLYTRHQQAIAAVITDMAMPVMDGPAAIVALKALNPRVKIIASSGLAGESIAKAMSAGVGHFIPKPYTTAAMLEMLDAVLRDRPAEY